MRYTATHNTSAPIAARYTFPGRETPVDFEAFAAAARRGSIGDSLARACTATVHDPVTAVAPSPDRECRMRCGRSPTRSVLVAAPVRVRLPGRGHPSRRRCNRDHHHRLLQPPQIG